MPYPSPWRASAGTLALFVGVAVVFGALLWLQRGDVLPGVAVGGIVVVLFGVAELQAAVRLNRVLREFGGQVPGEPESDQSYMGDQSVRWPDLGLAVEGWTHRFTVRGLEVTADGTYRDVSTWRPREGAREVLDDLGHEPSFDRFEERLPSIYPRVSALRVGVPAAVVAFVVVVFGGVQLVGGALPLWTYLLAPTAGAVTAWVRWSGLAGVRRALVALADGLHEGGVELERIDLLEGVLRPEFAVRTSQGMATLRCVAHPRGRLRVAHLDREREARLPAARAVGRDLAGWLTATPVTAGDDVGRQRGALTVVERFSFLAIGLFCVGFGGVLLGRPGVVTAGECTEACLFEAFVETVPLGNVVAGLLLVAVGGGMLAIAYLDRVPVSNWRPRGK